ncbi:MAG: MBOAT family protein [Burkholderiaceae bacterium]|nr:MAG: MBOAT family protein [Burkholderiaceae bacterium]
MLFNSYAFILCFLPIAVTGFFLLGKYNHRLAASWLAAASLFFYAWWDYHIVYVLVLSVLFNYSCGYLIWTSRSVRKKRLFITLGIAGDLSVLGFFKYVNFFIDTTNQLLANQHIGLPTLSVVLPLGISFFTFTQIAYLVDIFRDEARHKKLIHYVLFVTYFPHLIAGPLIHHKQVMPQFAKDSCYRPDAENIARGITIFCLGLFKKVIIADNLAVYANGIFNAVHAGGQPALLEAWSGGLAYALQIYFDFSGYSDMAIGLSLLFNIRMPINFDSPYKSSSIIEFWRRWHMTLSAFLRDYLYIPLGGNRGSKLLRYRNLMLTMLLGGLWHGAGWTFIIWGGLHGLYLSVNHLWQEVRQRYGIDIVPAGIAKPLAITITFLLVALAWIAFRAQNVATMLEFYRGMFGVNGISLPGSLQPYFHGMWESLIRFEGATPLAAQQHLSLLYMLFWIMLGLTLIFGMPNLQQWTGYTPNISVIAPESGVQSQAPAPLGRWKPSLASGLLVATVFITAFLYLGRDSPFLYFQF